MARAILATYRMGHITLPQNKEIKISRILFLQTKFTYKYVYLYPSAFLMGPVMTKHIVPIFHP